MNTTRVFSLLVVDDDPLIHQSLKLCLPSHWRLFSAHSLESLQSSRFYHGAFVDMHLTSSTTAEGLQVIREILGKNPQLEVVAMSGDLRRDLMESCLKAGAQRFLAKPFNAEEVMSILSKLEALWELRSQPQTNIRHQWVGQSPASQNIRAQIAALKGESQTVLVEGETGCGKEVVASLLHIQEGSRPFIAVNLASIPDNLFESEMFGHIKGAFTGADSNKIGLAEAAQGGDLFLDEIEALSLPSQAKLLRFLESGEIKKVGAKTLQYVETRVICASNQDLSEMVKKGLFREDLLFRISSHRIQLPPLRKRLSDIIELANFFLEKEKPRRHKEFTQDGYEALQNYSWPGNVRELKRLCEQLALTSPLPLLRAEDVNKFLKPSPASSDINSTNHEDLTLGLNALVESFERNIIGKAIKSCADVEEAARLLKISRSNLYKKIKDLNIDEDNL